MDRYLAEFDFRQKTRVALGINDTQRAAIALQGVKGKRLRYGTTEETTADYTSRTRRTRIKI